MPKWTPPKTKTGQPCRRCKKERLCHAHDGKSRRGGAPTVFTNEKRTDFLEAIRVGGPGSKSLAAACRLVGWSPETFRLWKRAYENGKATPELATFFGEELPKAQEYRRSLAMRVLRDSMLNEDSRLRLDAAKYTLTNFHGDEAKTAKQSIEVTTEEREVADLRRILQAHRSDEDDE